MAPNTNPAFEREMSKLLLSVDQDNVLAVHRVFQKHADDLRSYLRETTFNVRIGLCGDDPVSAAAAGPASFGGKIAQLLDVHWRHWEELDAVAARLRDVARTYGHTEHEITKSMTVDR